MADDDLTNSGNWERIDPQTFWLDAMKTYMEELETGKIDASVKRMLASRMVPLWYAPLLFCGVPGDDKAINPDLAECYHHAAQKLAEGIRDRDLMFVRHPSSWMFDDGETITPRWLIDARDLDTWSRTYFGLRTGLEEYFEPEGSNQKPQPDIDRPLATRERRTLLVVIAALAKEAGIDIDRHEAAGAAIEKATELLGARVDAGTIATHLKKVPEAIEARKK